ncbi:alpha/beta hydrolase family protein [Amnibacterium setariae]|uniref:alpha/beta hydrolase family protein n=1 Tax=Amnibacterium setariae TaxID=2306585 RepID=UPI00131485D5|nr:alpha/beta fold hydrolase [Amnibacterium setariae]
MPIRLPRRALAAIGALLVTAAMAGCAASSTEVPGARPVVAATPVAEPADLRAAGARLVDDARSASLVIVPKRPNGGLVVFLHGWGQTRWSLLSRREEAGVAHAVSEAGFTILAADGLGKAWGDPASLDDYQDLITRTKSTYRLRDVFLMGESMGGLATMQLARRLPDVRAATAWFPVCDLRTMHQPRFQESIRDAWRGRSRAAVSPVRVGDTPLLVWASPADTVVNATTNAAVCVAEAKAAGADVTYFRTTGEHGDPSNYQPTTVVTFFEKYRTPGA